MKNERGQGEEERGDVPWQKHPSRSAEAAPGAAIVLLVSFLSWLEVDEE